jgi:hypothetical protein
VRGGEVGDGVLALESTSDEYVAVGSDSGDRCIGSQVFAEVYDGIFGCTFSVCVKYLMTFCVIDVIAGRGCQNISQLEVRNESTGAGVDPSELEEAFCVGC